MSGLKVAYFQGLQIIGGEKLQRKTKCKDKLIISPVHYVSKTKFNINNAM